MHKLIEYTGKQKMRGCKPKTKSNSTRTSTRIKDRNNMGTKDQNAPPDPNDIDLTLKGSIPEDLSTPKRGTRNSTESLTKKVCKTGRNVDKSHANGLDGEEITNPTALD